MVGLIIFSMGMLLLSSMMMVSLKGNKWSDMTTQTVQLIRDKIEDFRHEDPVNMVNGSDVVDGFNRQWLFQDLTTNLKSLTVIVDWADERSMVHSCTTTTYIQI
jgi:hypothetical protein